MKVIAAVHPLRGARIEFDVEPGASVEDLVVEAAERGNVTLNSMSNAVVVIGDRIVPKNRWRHVRPKAGAVVIKAVPAAAALPLIVSVAGFAAQAALPLTGLIGGLVSAGIAWIAPLHPELAPRDTPTEQGAAA